MWMNWAKTSPRSWRRAGNSRPEPTPQEIGPACGFFTLADRDSARRRAPTGGVLQRAAKNRADPDAPENTGHAGRGRDAWRHVSGRHGFPGGPGRGQFLRPGSGAGDLRGGGGGGARGRHPHAFHAGDGSGSRSAHGPQRGSLHRRSLPLHAHRRDHRARHAGFRHLRSRQGHRGADRFSHAKRTGERPRARRDRGVGALACARTSCRPGSAPSPKPGAWA